MKFITLLICQPELTFVWFAHLHYELQLITMYEITIPLFMYKRILGRRCVVYLPPISLRFYDGLICRNCWYSQLPCRLDISKDTGGILLLVRWRERRMFSSLVNSNYNEVRACTGGSIQELVTLVGFLFVLLHFTWGKSQAQFYTSNFQIVLQC